MRNLKSIREVSNSKFKEFTIPLYDSYCFSNIFGSIKELFRLKSKKSLPSDTINNNDVKKVVLFIVDAFGWKFYEKYKNESKILSLIEDKGVVSKLTAQFPSTTTAEITTALTNKTVFEHGIYEWFYYEPIVGDNINAFLYKEARSEIKENIKYKGINPDQFLPRNSFFHELFESNINSIAYQPNFINNSTYSKYMFRDANLKGYNSYDDLKENLLEDLNKNSEREYYYVYLPEIDSIGHKYGCSSIEFDHKVKKWISFMDNLFEGIKNSGIAIMITADHGQIENNLRNNIYLNYRIPNLGEYLIKNKRGKNISPCGYNRDLFLHVKEDKIEELKSIIEDKLKGEVLVFKLEELVKIGIFKEITERLKERVGNLIILPLKNNCVWIYEKGIFEISVNGVHGGLSKEEMEIPFLYYLT